MDSRKVVFSQTGIVALGQVICIGVMIGIYALLGRFDYTVLLGAIAGAAVSVINFFFMALAITLATDKAQQQDVKGGKAMIRSSYLIRIILMLLILVAFAKSGYFNVLALLLPLAFVRPILTVAEFFRKTGVDSK